MDTQNIFIDYEHSLMLKDLKFNEPCVAFYDEDKLIHPNIQEVSTLIDLAGNLGDEQKQKETELWKGYDNDDFVFIDYVSSKEFKDVLCPTWYQVKQWLLDKHKIWIKIIPLNFKENKFSFAVYRDGIGIIHNPIDTFIISPTVAEIEGIKKTIEFLLFGTI